MNKKLGSFALVGALVLAACGGGSDSEAFDTDRACRVGERLVEETASGDRDGVIRQIERLDDLDGIADSGLDVDDLDSIAEGLDEQSVEDLVAEFDELDCDLDTPDVKGAPEPETTEVETTTPSTEAPVPETTEAEEPPATEPPPETTAAPETTPDTEPDDTEPDDTGPDDTEPDDTEPADTTPEETTPPAAGSGVPVDIGSTGPGAEIGINRATADVIADYGLVDFFFSPDTNVVELRVRRSDSSFGDDIQHSNSESITMSAATTMTIEEVRTAYRTALEALDAEFDFSESTSNEDGRRTVGVEASPADFDLEIGNWDVQIAADDDNPGIVLIEVDRLSTVLAPVPAIAEPAQPLLQETADIGSDLGWAVTGYGHTLSINSFDASLSESGSVDWDVSEDNTVRAAADAIQEAIGEPIDNEDADEESISWAVDDDERAFWFVNYSEFSGTTVSYSP